MYLESLKLSKFVYLYADNLKKNLLFPQTPPFPSICIRERIVQMHQQSFGAYRDKNRNIARLRQVHNIAVYLVKLLA